MYHYLPYICRVDSMDGMLFLHVFANCSRQKIAIRSKYSHLLNIYRQGGMAQHLIRCKVAAASEIITSTI